MLVSQIQVDWKSQLAHDVEAPEDNIHVSEAAMMEEDGREG